MEILLERSARVMGMSLDLGPRVVLLVAALLLAPTYLVPLWKLTIVAPESPEGRTVAVYGDKFETASPDRGPAALILPDAKTGDERLARAAGFRWIPFAVGALALLFLRASVQGTMSSLLDVFVLYIYFGVFSLWSFRGELGRYGHAVSPTTTFDIGPILPPLFGYRRLGSFEVHSYPALGSYFLAAAALVLAGALFFAWRRRAELAGETRVAG